MMLHNSSLFYEDWFICHLYYTKGYRFVDNRRGGDSIEIGDSNTKHDLTLPSNILVSMTIVGTRCSQIMHQKSSTELSVGPVINNYTAAC